MRMQLMNKFLSKITPEWSLRIGLGAMYVYSGIDIIRHPTAWFWAVRPLFKWLPLAMQPVLSKPEVMTKYLVFQGIGELVLAFLFLAWFLPKYLVKWAALVSVLEFAGILVLIPIDAITFRDIGLLGAFMALWLMLVRGNFDIPAEAHEPGGLKRAEHHDKPVEPKKLTNPEEPVVETFEEFMGGQK